jgi:hypothetical protein
VQYFLSYKAMISADGKLFACLAADRQVRVFTFLTGKLRRKYDESLKALQEVQQSGDHRCKVDSLDFGRRLAGEKEIDRDPSSQGCNAVFDKSGHFLYYPTPLGVKCTSTSCCLTMIALQIVLTLHSFMSSSGQYYCKYIGENHWARRNI